MQPSYNTNMNMNQGYNPQQPMYTNVYVQETNVPLETHQYSETEEKFPTTFAYRDWPFIILFVLHLSGIGVIIGLGLSTTPTADSVMFLPEWLVSLNDESTRFFGMCGVLILISFVLSIIYLQLMKCIPKALIYMGIVFNVLTLLAGAIYFGITGNIVVSVIMGIFCLLFIIYFFFARSRIPFAVEMIKSVVDIVQNHPGTQITAYVSIIVQIAWLTLWSFAVVMAQRFNGYIPYIAFVFLVFSFYWVLEVIKNVVHVTVSGVVATVYFMRNNMPSYPTLGALKRSLTTSFGSICLGSLIVAFLKTLRALIRMARNERGGVLVFIVDCILSCLEGLMRYFNHYAFCQVAIYGKTFCQAAKATWHLFETSGFEAIANDNLIDGVLWMGIFFNSLVTGGVGALIGFLMYTEDTSMITYFFVIGFFIGFVLMILAMQVIDSSVTCSFVCFAEDKETLRQNNPELYQRFMETYNLTW